MRCIQVNFGDGVGRVRLLSTKFYHNIAVTEDNRLFEYVVFYPFYLSFNNLCFRWGKNPQELKMKMFVMRRLRNAKDAEKRERVRRIIFIRWVALELYLFVGWFEPSISTL